MSNILNVLGSTDGALGPVNILYDCIVQTGDSGQEIDLGETAGTTLRVTVEKADLNSDQNGTVPFNKIATGIRVELECNLVRVSFEIISKVMQAFNSYSSGTGGISQGNPIGQDDLSIAVPIQLTRVIAGVGSSDTDDMLILPACAAMTENEFAFDAATQRVISAKFQCYRSTHYLDATTGEGLYFFTRSAIDAGNVVFST